VERIESKVPAQAVTARTSGEPRSRFGPERLRQKAASEPRSRVGHSDYLQQVQADKLAEDAKKGSCLPKLFMLLMPFAALGTYLFLRS